MERNKDYLLLFLSIFGIVVFVGGWYYIADILKIFPSYILPSPLVVLKTFIYKLTSQAPDGATLFGHILKSFQVAGIGYLLGAVVGIPIGILSGWYKKVDLFVTPLFDLLKPISPIAWIPIFVLMFGIGVFAKSSVIFISAVIPNIVNSYSGVKLTPKAYIWVGKTFGASDRILLRKVVIPSSLPMVFTGLKVSLNSSLLASTRGLGYMISQARLIARSDIILVGMFTIGGLGVILSILLDIFENKYIRGRNE